MDMKHSFAILTLITSYGNTIPFIIEPVKTGVIFEKISDVILSTHKWTVSVEYNLDKVLEEKAQLLTQISDLTKSVRQYDDESETKGRFFTLLSSLNSTTENLDKSISAFVQFLPNNRRKRSFNTGGKIIKFLFGNPDHSDRKLLFSDIHKLRLDTNHLIVDSTIQKVKIENAEKTLTGALSLIKELSINLTNFNGGFQEQVNENFQNFTEKFHRLRHENILELELSTLIYYIVELQNTIFDFHLALQSAINHRLSPLLFSPETLFTILETIKSNVKKPLELIAPVSNSTLYDYFALTEVKAFYSGNKLFVDVAFPLSDVGGQFEMYKIISIPQIMNSSNFFIIWELQSYFLVDASRRFHTVLDTNQKNNCKGANIVVCSLKLPLHTPDDPLCEFSLFMNDTSKFCKRTVKLLEQNFIVTLADAWIVAVFKPMSLTFICMGVEPQTIEVNNSFIIKNASNCEISNKYMRLQSSFGFNSAYQISVNSLKISAIQIIKEEEKPSLINLKTNFDLTGKIGKLIEAHQNQLSFTSFMEQIENELNQPSITPEHVYFGMGSFIFVLTVAAVGLLFCKYKQIKKKILVKVPTSDAEERMIELNTGS